MSLRLCLLKGLGYFSATDSEGKKRLVQSRNPSLQSHDSNVPASIPPSMSRPIGHLSWF